MVTLLHRPWMLFAVQLLIGLPALLVFFYGFASLGGLLHDWVPLLIYLYLMVSAMRALKRALWLEAELGFVSRGWGRLRASLVLVFTAYPLVYALAFAMACRELHAVFGVGFIGDQSAWQWAGFGVDNLLEVVLADMPAIYGLQLSRIEPVSFGARTLVFGFRLSLDFLLIAWAGKCIRLALARKRDRDPGGLASGVAISG